MDVGDFSYDLNTAPPGYRCGKCDLRGVKLWRESHSSHVDLRCAACAGATDDLADSDQIGCHVPAVPDEDGKSWWGYTSVPQAGCEWWARLPCAVAVLPGRASMTAAEARAVDAKFAATMTTTDTRAALEAAIDAYATAAIANAGAALTDAWAAIAWAAISSAITAHVAAEVARALACAPGVEEAIAQIVVCTDLMDNAGSARARDALRAAIAADKARAVEAGISSAFSKLLPGRPTPDEARRLVEAHHLDLLSIADTVASLHGAPGPGLRGHCVAQADKLRLAAGTARTALLRALGVEA